MALLIKPDGTTEKVTPTNGKWFDLIELQAHVGGLIELIILNQPGHDLVCNHLCLPADDVKLIAYVCETGLLDGLPFNKLATDCTSSAYGLLVGNMIVGLASEMDPPAEPSPAPKPSSQTPYLLIHENDYDLMQNAMREAYERGYRLHSFHHHSDSSWMCAVMELVSPSRRGEADMGIKTTPNYTAVLPGTDAIAL